MRSVSKDIQAFRDDPDNDRLFLQERTMVELTELICREMQRQGLSRSELAERMGKSKGQVTQMLSGGRNLTLRSLSDMLLALGLALEPMARPADQPPGRYVKVPDAADGAWTQHSGVTTVNTRERSPYRLVLEGDRPTPPRPSLAGAA